MSTTEQIKELISTKGKSSPAMTNALKSIGNGKMEDGINRLFAFGENAGKVIGEKKGIIEGAIGASLILGIAYLIKKQVDEKKILKSAGDAILKGLDDELTEENVIACEKCGKILNMQDGFCLKCDTWVCTNCGEEHHNYLY